MRGVPLTGLDDARDHEVLDALVVWPLGAHLDHVDLGDVDREDAGAELPVEGGVEDGHATPFAVKVAVIWAA